MNRENGENFEKMLGLEGHATREMMTKAEAEVDTGSLGNKEAMREAVERRKNKERKVVFDMATKFAKKRAETTKESK